MAGVSGDSAFGDARIALPRSKIEHRLFSFISQNWRGRPLLTHEVIVKLIASTTTRTGGRVRSRLDTKSNPAGVKA